MAIIGIDLGTTNSLVAVWQNTQVEIIPNAHGEMLTPSAVSISDNGQMLVGNPARDRLVTHPQLSAAYFKRMMGSNKKTTLGNKSYSPEELSALVLRQLKADAEEYLKEPVEEAIISVPAYFNDNQRNATIIAAELAGLKVERLINEPTAAALSYGINEKSGDQTFIVIDLGGGTLDVSIMEKFDNLMEVHASAGDSFLGGEDFTEKLVRDFCEEQKTDYNTLPPQDKARIYHRLNLLKHQLSEQKSVDTTLILHEKEIPYSLTLDQFTTQVDGLLKRLLEPIEKSIRDASINTQDLDDVILVGGASRMPIIRQFVTRLFGRFPSCRLDPDQVVVMGAAIQGALKHRNEDLEDIVLTDVCPFSMGIEIIGDLSLFQVTDLLFSVILERNLVIPCSKEKMFQTVSDNQDKIDVVIYQGEHRLVKNNIKLGSCTVKVPKNKKGEEWISVRFTYDINGLLEVMVKVISTGKERRMVIKNSDNRMSDAEIAQALKKLDNLKIHPRDQAVNQALLSRAERLFQERLGQERNYISVVTSQFESILNTQDEVLIEKESSAFKEVLDSMERDIWE